MSLCHRLGSNFKIMAVKKEAIGQVIAARACTPEASLLLGDCRATILIRVGQKFYRHTTVGPDFSGPGPQGGGRSPRILRLRLRGRLNVTMGTAA